MSSPTMNKAQIEKALEKLEIEGSPNLRVRGRRNSKRRNSWAEIGETPMVFEESKPAETKVSIHTPCSSYLRLLACDRQCVCLSGNTKDSQTLLFLCDSFIYLFIYSFI